jgi:hypothetical protein
MQHETILKRPNGDRLKIIVIAFTDYSRDISYRIKVLRLPARKKLYQSIHFTDDFSWRRLDQKGRDEYEINLYLEHVTKEEIMEAKIKCWEAMNPQLNP